MKFILLITCVIISAANPLEGQPAGSETAQITLEDIWRDNTFRHRTVPGFRFLNDGRHYSRKAGAHIVTYDIVTGEATDTLFSAQGPEQFTDFDDYAFSADEALILLRTDTERIYRHSFRAYYHIYDRSSGMLSAVFPEGKVMHCTFSPDGNAVAFVFENNLYWKDLDAGELHRITDDGAFNRIINGSADWVYEEEFSFTRAFQWSPDGTRIAFYRFDESAVPEFTMTNYTGGLYPDYVTFKYPKVGETNATVNILIYDLSTWRTTSVDVGSEPDGYIPRILWTQDPDVLCVFRMNRHQNHLVLYLADAVTGETHVLLEEKNKYYIEIHDNLRFLADGRHFIWTSEGEGWNRIYLYDMKGTLVRRLTEGNFDVITFYGVDEARGLVYYQAAAQSPLQREVYATDLATGETRQFSPVGGVTTAQFSGTFDYYTLNHRSADTPARYSVHSREGRELRILEDNADLREKQETYGVMPLEFFGFTTRNDVQLDGWMIKPPGFDASRAYPVLMHLYGGPGSQRVYEEWMGPNYWWFQMLAQQGYIVACVDNRGTGGRGEEFHKMTYLQLGHYETIDQVDAAVYLGSLPYVDASRIAIFGWSYGGYLSSLALLKGEGAFRAAIAVAPVTNWRWYDTIYTERYMRTEEENPGGYADNSPINFAARLEGDYLLVHGGADDNVHWQHTAEMAGALIRAGKQFDMYYYPNQNHSIAAGNARLHLYTKMTEFLKRAIGE